ncbi:MAG: mechanosensitive ion channel domain-containing protein [Myxococcota bacterium]
MENLPEGLQPYLQPETLVAFGQSLVVALVTLAIGWLLAGWVASITRQALERAKVDVALTRFLGNIARYVVIIATVTATAEAVGIQTTSVLAILASAGLAVGLALQGSLANFASGVMILLFRPFRIGDWITIGGLTGQVADIGLFATVLMRPDGTKVVVPNGSITGDVIENHTELNKRRATVDIGVEYGVDLDDARAALARATERVSAILPNNEGGKDFAVYFASFGASSLDFKVHAWCEAGDFLAVQEEIRIEIYRELGKSGIGIPFPQLDLHVDSAVLAQAS